VASSIDILRSAGIRARHLRGDGSGVGGAMLRGLEVSKGAYVFFLDADNVLKENFMSEAMPKLMKGMFVSVLSKSVVSRVTGLFYASQLLATLRGGLKFHKKYGFVNILYIWHKNIVAQAAMLSNPKLSLLDQVNLKDLIKKNIAVSMGHAHMDRIFVEDIRHVYEDFNPKFIYSRLKWYWGSIGRKILNLGDVKVAIAIFPITFLLLYIISLITGFVTLLALIAPYILLLLITSKIKSESPILQLAIGVFWLPPLLLLKGIIAYIVSLSILRSS
jgi:glycosyltransferase involved in cell wall biosynthesis